MKKIRILCCLLIFVLAAGATAFTQETFNGSAENILVRNIEITGNYEVDDETILGAVSSKVGEPLSTKKLEEDLQSIFDLGFFSEDVRATLDEYQDGAKIVFHVVENPVLDKIIIEGSREISTTDILDIIKSQENFILNSNQLKEDVKNIEKAYVDAGFRAARVLDVGVDSERNLRVIISEGIIQDIRVVYMKESDETKEREEFPSGKTKDYVILREMRVRPGDVFHADKFQKDLQKIFNLGYFEDISTRYEPGDEPGGIVVVVEVQEGRTGQIGFGAGYSGSSGFVGHLSYSERNLQGRGRRLDTRVEAGGKRTNYELGYFEPWLTKNQTSIEATIFRTTQTDLRYGLGGVFVPNYEERHTGFRLTLGQPISYYTKVFVGFKHDEVDVSPDEHWITRNLDGLSRSVTFTVRTDTRDNIFETTAGRFDTASWEVNGHIVGGDFDYHKLNFDIRRYLPVRKKQVLCGRLMVGLSKDAIPRFDWFDLGGVNTLRGYDENQFAGTKFLLINGEYRFNLSGNFSAVLFGDVGNTWLDVSDMSLSPNELAKSAGVGLRFKIPALGMGPLRLDYAWAFSIGETKLEFGFGHMF
ncbi:MAG: BamA/TamA family outer membrane protein [bacterium]